MQIAEAPPRTPRLHAELRNMQESMNTVDNAGWLLYRSSFENYRKRFGPYLNDGDLRFLESIDSPTVIDFMAPTNATAGLISRLPQKDKMGIAVELRDRRRLYRRFRDWTLNVHQVQGDITRQETWEMLARKLNGRKANLIMERAVGGLAHIPYNKRLYKILIGQAWEHLSDQNGLMLIHIPSYSLAESAGITETQIADWISLLNSSGIPSSIGPVSDDSSVFRLQKTPLSPAKLPSI